MRPTFFMLASAALAVLLSGCLPELEGAQCTRDLDCSPGLVCNQGLCAQPGQRIDGGGRADAATGDLGGRRDLGVADARVVDAQVGDAEQPDVSVPADVFVPEGDALMPDAALSEDAALSDMALRCTLADGTDGMDGSVCSIEALCPIPGRVVCDPDAGSGTCEPDFDLGDGCQIETAGCVSDGNFACVAGRFACTSPRAGDRCRDSLTIGDNECSFEGELECPAVNGVLACAPPVYATEPGCNGEDDDCDGRVDERDPALNDHCDCMRPGCRPVCDDGFADVDRNQVGCERGCDLGVASEQLIAFGPGERIWTGVVFANVDGEVAPAVVTSAEVSAIIAGGQFATRTQIFVKMRGHSVQLGMPTPPNDSLLNNHVLRDLHTHVNGTRLVIAALVDWGQGDVRPFVWSVTWIPQPETLSAGAAIGPSATATGAFEGYEPRHITAFGTTSELGAAVVAHAPLDQDIEATTGRLVLLRATSGANPVLAPLRQLDARDNLDLADRPAAVAAVGEGAETFLVALWRQRGGEGPPKVRLVLAPPDGAVVMKTLSLADDELPGDGRLSLQNVVANDEPQAIPLVVVPTTQSVRIYPGAVPVAAGVNSIPAIASWPLPSDRTAVFAWRTIGRLSYAIAARFLQPRPVVNSLYLPHGDLIVGGAPEVASVALPPAYQTLVGVSQSSIRAHVYSFHLDAERAGHVIARAMTCQ